VSRRTIARPAELAGTGLHSGASCRIRLEPAAGGTGIVFAPSDHPRAEIPARLDRVVAAERRTALGRDGARVETVEHLLAALYALGIDDARVVVHGPEVPILDGAFEPFVELIDRAGWSETGGRAGRLELAAALDVREGDAHYRIEPGERLVIKVQLSYAHPAIGHQSAEHPVGPGEFRSELQRARTFGMLEEVAALQARGLLRGASERCAVVLNDQGIVNTALRWPNEFARHKAGDLIGDLALLGARLQARVDAFRPSHRGNITCARAIARAARYTEDA